MYDVIELSPEALFLGYSGALVWVLIVALCVAKFIHVLVEDKRWRHHTFIALVSACAGSIGAYNWFCI